MNFYKIEIQTLPDGTTAVGATATYNDAMDAEAAFHSNCASALAAIKAGSIKACLIKVFGETGADVLVKYYNNVEPEE